MNTWQDVYSDSNILTSLDFRGNGIYNKMSMLKRIENDYLPVIKDTKQQQAFV